MFLLVLATIFSNIIFCSKNPLMEEVIQLARLIKGLEGENCTDEYDSINLKESCLPLKLGPGWGIFQDPESISLAFGGYGTGFIDEKRIREDLIRGRSVLDFPSGKAMFGNIVESLREIGLLESGPTRKKFTIGGHSYGGILAQIVARRFFRFAASVNGKVPDEYDNDYPYKSILLSLKKGKFNDYNEKLLTSLLLNKSPLRERGQSDMISVPESLVDQVCSMMDPDIIISRRCHFSRPELKAAIKKLDREIFARLFRKMPEISVFSFGTPRIFEPDIVRFNRIVIPKTYCFEIDEDPVPYLFKGWTAARLYLSFARSRFVWEASPMGKVIYIPKPEESADPHSSSSYLAALEKSEPHFYQSETCKIKVRFPTFAFLTYLFNQK